jgi:CheY-like chemotaxis protein
MPVQTEVEKLVLVSVQDREILELIREFLEPLGYTVEIAPEALVAGKAGD